MMPLMIGMAYIVFYFAFVLGVPILIIASAVFGGWGSDSPQKEKPPRMQLNKVNKSAFPY